MPQTPDSPTSLPREGLGDDSRLARYDNLLDMCGDVDHPTPIVRVNRVLDNPDVALYVKCEWVNPFGSIKDRTAKWLLNGLIERGELDGKTVIEATSRQHRHRDGGDLPAPGHPHGGYRPARALAREDRAACAPSVPTCGSPAGRHLRPSPHGRRVPARRGDHGDASRRVRDAQPIRQRGQRPRALRVHRPRDLGADRGRNPHFFAGLGTCGTIVGTRRYLKEQNPEIKIIGIEPVRGHHISGLKNMEETAVPANLDMSVIDELVWVDDEMTDSAARRLYCEESLMVGPSAAAIAAGALKYSASRPSGIAVTIAPDSGQKAASYLTSLLR